MSSNSCQVSGKIRRQFSSDVALTPHRGHYVSPRKLKENLKPRQYIVFIVKSFRVQIPALPFISVVILGKIF